MIYPKNKQSLQVSLVYYIVANLCTCELTCTSSILASSRESSGQFLSGTGEGFVWPDFYPDKRPSANLYPDLGMDLR